MGCFGSFRRGGGRAKQPNSASHFLLTRALLVASVLKDLLKNQLIGTVDLDLEKFPFEKSKEKWLDIIGMEQNGAIPVGG